MVLRKTRVAIEYAYRVRHHTPAKWVFWINAATRASFKEGFVDIAVATSMHHRNDYDVDILSIVRRWLCDVSNGQWLMVVDNVEDIDVFFSEVLINHATTDPKLPSQPLADYLPISPNGAVLITTRNRDFARRLKGLHNRIVDVRTGDYTSFKTNDVEAQDVQETTNIGISLEESACNVVALQQDHPLHHPPLALNFPLLLEKLLHYMWLAFPEPRTSIGKVRVRWTSVRPFERRLDITLTSILARSAHVRRLCRDRSWRCTGAGNSAASAIHTNAILEDCGS